MTPKTSSIVCALLLAIPAYGLAQEASGRYATANGQEMTQELPDGSKIQISHYTQISFANDSNHPLDNMSSDCVGRFHMAANDTLVTGDGMCTGFDAQGNSATFWWRVDQANTSDCPDLCGSWGYFNGTGKFKGIEGSGTWARDTMFQNGSSGTWKGTAKLK
jgi:hypothetical protein